MNKKTELLASLRNTCSVCEVLDLVPDATEHVEGFICIAVERSCPYHGKYLDLPDLLSNRFSIEVLKILEDRDGSNNTNQD